LISYVLAYGAGFVAQGAPADMPGLAALIEEAIRFPGFAFVTVQSPCITFGPAESQLKAHKAAMKPLRARGHDPSNRFRAMALAQGYGRVLHTGVLYRNPRPAPTYEAAMRARQAEAWNGARREAILERFIPAP
jgi:2-oxoglutarate ferredoxin oxidoreductase subunit beta